MNKSDPDSLLEPLGIRKMIHGLILEHLRKATTFSVYFGEGEGPWDCCVTVPHAVQLLVAKLQANKIFRCLRRSNLEDPFHVWPNEPPTSTQSLGFLLDGR